MEDSSEQLIEQLVKEIAKDSGIILAGSTFGKIVQFGLHVLLGRVLGVSNYGLYALGFSIIQLVSEVSLLGLRNGLVRFVALFKGEGDLERVKGTLVTAFSTAILGAVVCGVVLFLFSHFLSDNIFNETSLSPILNVFALTIPFFVLVQLAVHTARGFQKMAYYVGVQNILLPLLNVLFVGIAFLLGYRTMGAIYGFLITMIISATAGFFVILRKIFPEGLRLETKYEVKNLLCFCLPVAFIGFSQLMLNRTDRLIIGYFMTSQDVGTYSAASRIALQASFFITAFNMAFAPMIANLYNQQKIQDLGNLFRLVTRWILTLTIPVVIIMVLFPGILMDLFGPEYVAGKGALMVLATAYLINAVTGPVGLMLIMSGKQNIELINLLCAAGINLGLNIWLTQVYGILGAAVATGLSIGIINLARIIEVSKIIGIRTYDKRYLKSIMSGGGVILIYKTLTSWIGVSLTWYFSLLLCLLFYGGIVIMLGLEPEDKKLVKAGWDKIPMFLRGDFR